MMKSRSIVATLAGLLLCWMAPPMVKAIQSAAPKPAVAAQAAPAPPAPAPGPITPPAHPIRKATLQTYFDEIHYGSWIRRNWAEGYTVQKKNLPPWYPLSVWDAIVNAELKMDIAEVALPVYQKYMSEEVGQRAIRFFAGSTGQDMAAHMFAKQEPAQAAGESGNDAYTETVAEDRAREDRELKRMFAKLRPEDMKASSTFLQLPEWQQVEANATRITKELNDAEVARQKEIAKTVNDQHRDELWAAHRKYAEKPAPPK